MRFLAKEKTRHPGSMGGCAIKRFLQIHFNLVVSFASIIMPLGIVTAKIGKKLSHASSAIYYNVIFSPNSSPHLIKVSGDKTNANWVGVHRMLSF